MNNKIWEATVFRSGENELQLPQIVALSFHYMMLRFLKLHTDWHISPKSFFSPLFSCPFPILHKYTKFFQLLLCIDKNF